MTFIMNTLLPATEEQNVPSYNYSGNSDLQSSKTVRRKRIKRLKETEERKENRSKKIILLPVLSLASTEEHVVIA
jgi:hypothetical protein